MAKRRTQEEMIAEGKALIAARTTVARGTWQAWVKAHKDYSPATAAKYIKLAQAAQEAQAQTIDEVWATLAMEARLQWMHRVGARMVRAMADRVEKQDEVMARRKQSKYTYV